MSDDNDEFRARLKRENALEALAMQMRAGRDLQGLIERYLDSRHFSAEELLPLLLPKVLTQPLNRSYYYILL